MVFTLNAYFIESFCPAKHSFKGIAHRATRISTKASIGGSRKLRE